MKKFFLHMATALCIAGASHFVHAHETGQKTPDPGFRPPSEHASGFLQALDTATLAVYPSVVRTIEGTSWSVESQQQIVSLLNEREITSSIATGDALDPGKLKIGSQWEIFQNDMQGISDQLGKRQAAAAFSLVMAFVFPPGNQSIFGIHCYILDKQGENVFSFLLNSHHQLFADAGLLAADASESSRAMLIEKATVVGVTALLGQLEAARR